MRVGDVVDHRGENRIGVVSALCPNPYYVRVLFFDTGELKVVDIYFLEKRLDKKSKTC